MPLSSYVTAWLYYLEQDESLPPSVVASTLERAGVRTEPLNPEAPSGLGIVFFSAVSSQVCHFIRTFSHHGRERLLAVTTRREVAHSAVWELLQAGASDVLVWDNLRNPTDILAARLQRWQAVDDIVKS